MLGTDAYSRASVGHLEALRAALRREAPELVAVVYGIAGRKVILHVTNPSCGRIAENVSVRNATPDGDPGQFLWSWGQPIAPVTAPDEAARVVRRVLALHDPGTSR
ncbi:MAG TPA: hypothetical protein VNF47_20445 [Streptosporangiaceae bacterium]|nr:hypothetical protein [Streptosporangiaceae bacterium]